MSNSTFLRADESDLLVAAQHGDHQAYERLVGSHRPQLHGLCYRMLASYEDADDAVQETLIRAWGAIGTFEARSSVGTWLYKIATNVSLDACKRRARRELPLDRGPRGARGDSPGDALFDVPWIGPYPTPSDEPEVNSPEGRYLARESLELAFTATIQRLPPRQRAVLILRDVLDFSAIETAELLGTTVASVTSALQRARVTCASRAPVRTQRAELTALGPNGVKELARRYADAIDRGDVDALLSLLTENATWEMPPAPVWFQGLDDIAEFHRRYVCQVRWRHAPAVVNGQLAIGCYIFDNDQDHYVASVVDVLTVRDGKVAKVTAFLMPEIDEAGDALDLRPPGTVVFPRLGLPAFLPR
jgi:RNA polymerase sigma-70 factor (TIGR02960 family)